MLGPCLMFLSPLWWVVGFAVISLSTSFMMANIICITSLSGSSCGADLCIDTEWSLQLQLHIPWTSVLLTQWFHPCHCSFLFIFLCLVHELLSCLRGFCITNAHTHNTVVSKFSELEAPVQFLMKPWTIKYNKHKLLVLRWNPQILV